MISIGIIGNGFVGRATQQLACINNKVVVYDKNPQLSSSVTTTLDDICACDIIMISVPTPMNPDGSCSLDIIEMLIGELEGKLDLNKKPVVIRSTVPVGTSKRLNCYFMPEFLTEKNYLDDFKNNKEWIFGIKNTIQDDNFIEIIKMVFSNAYQAGKISSDHLELVDSCEAEMIKLFRNTFLATKIAFCNEIYQYSQLKGVNYENVRRLATHDTRIGPSHSQVPGHDGKFGFGGTCFPKDTQGLLYDITQTGMKSYLLKAVVDRNLQQDRQEKDWETNKGRSVI